MDEIIKEMCWVPGRECGECGDWVSPHSPTPCGGSICEKLLEKYLEDNSE